MSECGGVSTAKGACSTGLMFLQFSFFSPKPFGIHLQLVIHVGAIRLVVLQIHHLQEEARIHRYEYREGLGRIRCFSHTKPGGNLPGLHINVQGPDKCVRYTRQNNGRHQRTVLHASVEAAMPWFERRASLQRRKWCRRCVCGSQHLQLAMPLCPLHTARDGPNS